jgi:hypothetical protein
MNSSYNNANKYKNMCQNCGRRISGRNDKKFCDDQCRNNYNNVKYFTEEFKMINRILRHNRIVLKTVLGEDSVVEVNKKVLLDYKFDFNYHTHILVNTNEEHIFCIYEFGYKLNKSIVEAYIIKNLPGVREAHYNH